MNIDQTLYGNKKRAEFVLSAIKPLSAANILDFGCGTGKLLTIPLAKKLKNVTFHAVDNHKGSIDAATQANDLPNLSFYTKIPQEPDKYDMIILSDVLEHVDDPTLLLRQLNEHLKSNGKLLLTIPNGYGPFEFIILLRSLFVLVLDLLKIKIIPQNIMITTLADSPHINFFSFKEINSIINKTNYRIINQRNRTIFCGFLFNLLSIIPGAVRLNAWLADYLHPSLVSGWMFVCAPSPGKSAAKVDYQNDTYYKRVKRYLNTQISAKQI